tara:strand:+ start:655 stop:1002 length:348 start_codon:yes stop_codon:yes gene_type:complete
MIDTHKFAMFLSEFRKSSRQISTTQVEALLLIASGIDNVSDLQQAMFLNDGSPFPRSSAGRIVNYLGGRGRYCKGKWVNQGGEPLIKRRNHPHKQGYQLILTNEGEKLIKCYLDK